jgi:rfaE bifunctional protein kinase chain/domain
VRIDRAGSAVSDTRLRSIFERSALEAASRCDAVVISDYGTGLVTPALADRLRRRLRNRGRRRVSPIFVDSRYELLKYRRLTACTPNESEVEQILDMRIGEHAESLERAGREILRRTGMDAVLITRGSRGMALFEQGRPAVHIPIFGSDEVADVTGAGDTVIATMALAVAAGASFYEAARLANYAGGLVVMKRGTATVSRDEMVKAITTDHFAETENWSQEGPPQGRKTGAGKS